MLLPDLVKHTHPWDLVLCEISYYFPLMGEAIKSNFLGMFHWEGGGGGAEH